MGDGAPVHHLMHITPSQSSPNTGVWDMATLNADLSLLSMECCRCKQSSHFLGGPSWRAWLVPVHLDRPLKHHTHLLFTGLYSPPTHNSIVSTECGRDSPTDIRFSIWSGGRFSRLLLAAGASQSSSSVGSISTQWVAALGPS